MKCLQMVIMALVHLGEIAWIQTAVAAPADSTIQVGVYQNRPKVFLDAEGKAVGFFPDLLNAIATAEGWQIDYVPCAWEECLAEVEAGQLDLMVDVANTPERLQRFDFNQEIVLSSWSAVYTPTNRPLSSILDLDQKRIAVLRDSVQYAALKQQARQFSIHPQLVVVDDFPTMFNLLQQGKVDAGVMNRFFGDRVAAQNSIVRTDIVLEVSHLHFITTKGTHADLLLAIDRQLRLMKQQPKSPYYQAWDRWLRTPLGKRLSLADIWQIVWLMGGVSLMVMLIGVGLWNRSLKREIRERRRTEDALRLMETRFQLFAENSQAVLWICDPVTHRQIYVNPAYEQVWGRSCQSLYDNPKTLLDSVLSVDRPILEEILAHTYRGSAFDCDYRIVRADGEIRWIHDRSFLLADADQGIFWMGGIAEDITDRKRGEQTLRQSELLFRSLFEQARIGIAFCGSEGQIIRANPKYCEITGYSADELLKMTFFELTDPSDRSANLATFRQMLEGKINDFNLEKRYIRKDGTPIWVEVTGAILRSPSGSPQAVIGLVDDISSRKQAEASLRASEQFLRSIYNHAEQGIFMMDVTADGDFHYVALNPSQERVTGITSEVIRGQTPEDIFSPEQAVRVRGNYRRCLNLGKPITYEEQLCFRGRDSWWLTTLSPVRDETGRIVQIIGTTADITERKQMEVALQEREMQLRNIANAVPGAVYQLRRDATGNACLLYLSEGVRSLYGLDPETAMTDINQLYGRVVPEDLPLLFDSMQVSADTLQPWSLEFRVQPTQGPQKWILDQAIPRPQTDNSIIWDGILTDISQLKQVEIALQASETRLRNMAANIPGALFQYVLRPDGTEGLLYMSPGCYQLWEISAEAAQANAQPLWDMIHPDDLSALQASVAESARTLQPWQHSWRITTPSGIEKWLQAAGRPEQQANGEVIWDTVVLDISDRQRSEVERQRAEAQLAHYALHDVLTDLPNRKLLVQRLELAIQRNQRHPHCEFALLFLDLDRFKVINDSLGHQIGDQLLIAIARKLQSLIRGTDLAARLGGDEFVILLEDVENHSEIVHVADRIITSFQAPLMLEGREVSVTTSIGIVMGGQPWWDATDLLRNADIAMYRAKAQGRDRYEIFDLAMHTQAVQRLNLENDLRKALDRQELVLYYQPIVFLATGRLTGFEALVRWQHPLHGLVPPQRFIEIAEETGLILPLSDWLLQQATRQLADWHQQFPQIPPLSVSVNLSVRNLHDPALLDKVKQAITHLTPSGCQLVLEITESMLIQQIEHTTALLDQLKLAGAQISIDDFGTGYSSLSYLHCLPADTLKIDASFVRQMQADPRNQKIVQTIVTLSDQLGLKAIAEGIETKLQLQQLQQLGCEYGQGYLLAPPLPVTAATELLQSAARAPLIKV